MFKRDVLSSTSVQRRDFVLSRWTPFGKERQRSKFVIEIASCLILIACVLPHAAYANDLQFEQLEHGFVAMYTQADPFDGDSREYLYFRKNDFTFRCGAVSFERSNTRFSYDSFSFQATIALKVDSQSVHQLQGTYSTHSFGSDIVNDDRVYSADITPDVLNDLKHGHQLQAAGKFGGGGWDQYSLDLKGFNLAFSKVCANE
jgi:hypothetical protein